MLNGRLEIDGESIKLDAYQAIESKNSLSFSVLFDYPCKSDSICKSINATISPGIYLFELWGAQGGIGTHTGYKEKTAEIAKGGYASALFEFISTTKIFLFIGGKGTDAAFDKWQISPGGFNGGGKIGGDGNAYSPGIGGKGGTDSQGGTISNERSATNGSKGQGWDGSGVSKQYSSDGGGGGGGGYFGGSGGTATDDHPNGGTGSGGGGSGYISPKHLHFFNTPQLLSGDKSFPSPNGGEEIGHTGSGAIRITYYPFLLHQITCKSKLFLSHVVFLISLFINIS